MTSLPLMSLALAASMLVRTSAPVVLARVGLGCWVVVLLVAKYLKQFA